ncbi:MAG: M36 family metallopeptidase [Sandaracinaceae bacterium]|nr:M36 family metallopeptidase [Sandaracinaceae bacterium]
MTPSLDAAGRQGLAWVAAALVLAAPAAAGAQALFDAYATSPRAPVVAPPIPAGLVAAGRDAQRDVPTLLVGRRALPAGVGASPLERARAHVRALAPLYGVGDLATLEPRLARATPSGGALVIFGQRVAGVEALETRLSLLLDVDGALVAAGGQLYPARAGRFARDAASALAVALADRLGPGAAAGLRYVATGPDGDERWSAPSARLDAPARVGRVLYPLPSGLVAAHYVELWADGDLFAYAIDAGDGRLLLRRRLTVEDAFEYLVYADAADPPRRLFDSPFGDTTPYPARMPVDEPPPFLRQVRAMVEGLDRGPRLGLDPWLAPGATETVGNNVDAYADRNAPDGLSAGDFRASVTAPGVFAHPLDPSRGPIDDPTQTMAGITHLFFVTNWLHDYFYPLGFDEVAGNAQRDNYGRGGREGDPLRAEAVDYSGRNNANMSTPRDGVSPRMQMFLWSGRARRGVATGDASYLIGVASFGPTTYDVTGPLAPGDTNGCTALGDALAGTVALVDRGGCSFVAKAQQAEAAGALALIIVNDQPGDARINMTGTGTVAIPTVMVSLEDGAALRARAGSPTRVHRELQPDIDSALDTQVVVHEWGHFLHHRLLACGSHQCGAQSEGWADFLALMMLLGPEDDLDGPFPMGSFANHGRRRTYYGIRRMPFSSNRAYDDLSFRHIANDEPLPTTHPIEPGGSVNSEVHNAGEVWASMLFDALTSLIRRSATPGAPYDFEGARRRFARYVVTGMQLAPRAPTFTEQRDALVAAALERDVEDARRIAAAFAGRGAGTCARSPGRYSEDLRGVIEDFAVGPRPRVTAMEVILEGGRRLCDDDAYLDPGETGWVRVVVANEGVVALEGATLALEPNDLGVTIGDGGERPLPTLAPGASREVWATLVAGTTDVRGGPMDVRATVRGGASCGGEIASARVIVDRDPGLSALEEFELPPRWLREVSLDGGTRGVWTVGPSVLGNPSWVLRGAGSAIPTDTAMELPELRVAPGVPFVVRFEHRFDFEADETRLWDGAVIELSTDGGASWRDVAELVDPGYTGPLTDEAMSTLALRPAYSRRNPSYPRADTVRLDFGTALAGERVRLRLRIATDAAVGSAGWEIDDLVITGTEPPPFPGHVENTARCAHAPTADAGDDRTVRAGDEVTLDGSRSADPDGDPLTFRWELLDATPLVALSEPTSARPSFATPPAITRPLALRFRLHVSDGHGGSASDDVTITVTPGAPGAPPDAGARRDGAAEAADGGAPFDPDAGPLAPGGGGCTCRAAPTRAAGWATLAWLAVLALGARRRRPRRELTGG